MENKHPIGFRYDESEIEAALPEEANDEVDLNEEIAKALNTLIGVLKYYEGSIRGIAVSVDMKGNYKTNIKY